MQQALIRSHSAGFTGADPAFSDTGLTRLQIWSAENGSRLFLFSVHDPAAAQEWLQAQQALGHITSFELIRTA